MATNDEFEKKMSYIELKINLILENTDSKTQDKYIEDEHGGRLVPKTLLEVWQDRSKKDTNQYQRRDFYRKNDKTV